MKAQDVIGQCKSIDAELLDWSKNLPPKTRYTISHLQNKCEAVWGNSYHVYPDLSSAYLWNVYRSARILVNDLLLDYVRALCDGASISYPRFHDQYHGILMILREMSLQILDSVPFHLGFREDASITSRAISGLFIIWNIYKVASMNFAAGEMRRWSIRRLDDLGMKMGIQQAITLAEVLRRRDDTEVGSRFDSGHEWARLEDNEWRWEPDVVESLLPEAGVIRLSRKKLRYFNDMPSTPWQQARFIGQEN